MYLYNRLGLAFSVKTVKCNFFPDTLFTVKMRSTLYKVQKVPVEGYRKPLWRCFGIHFAVLAKYSSVSSINWTFFGSDRRER